MASRKLRNAPPEMGGPQKLKTQLAIAKRMLKEVQAYETEVLTNEARIQKMRDDGKDPYDIRKQEEVLQESYMMVPDSKARLESAIEELQANLTSCAEDPDTVTAGETGALMGEASALIATVAASA